MRIYSWKGFLSGVLLVGLATGNLAADVVHQSMDLRGLVLVIVLYGLGFSAILRSQSRKLTRQDRLEEQDERNQLIAFKSKSMAFTLTQGISLLLMIALLIMGKLSGHSILIAMGVGLAFSFSISMFTELFTYLHYESND